MKQPWKLIFRGQSSSSQSSPHTDLLPRWVSPVPASWTQSRPPHVSTATCRLLTVCWNEAELPSVSSGPQRVKCYSCSRFLIHSHQILNPSPPSPPHPSTLWLFLLCIILFSFMSSFLFSPLPCFYHPLLLPSVNISSPLFLFLLFAVFLHFLFPFSSLHLSEKLAETGNLHETSASILWRRGQKRDAGKWGREMQLTIIFMMNRLLFGL